ncbi:MAG: hypothetical protein KUG78_16805 [Kangiellaceae bacterium]|nr:hypothetical protein [Kangiellaceae bacterium]
MIKTIFYSLAFMSISSYSMMTIAQDVMTIKYCSEIKENNERLKCFDQLSNLSKDISDSVSKSKKNSLLVSKETSAAANSKTAVSGQSHSQKNLSPPKITSSPSSTVDAFGKVKEKEHEIQSFSSHIVGKFNGWKKGKKLKLANGQIWKVANSNRVYVQLENPEITISKAIFGTFTAKVKGVTAPAKVRRVK